VVKLLAIWHCTWIRTARKWKLPAPLTSPIPAQRGDDSRCSPGAMLRSRSVRRPMTEANVRSDTDKGLPGEVDDQVVQQLCEHPEHELPACVRGYAGDETCCVCTPRPRNACCRPLSTSWSPSPSLAPWPPREGVPAGAAVRMKRLEPHHCLTKGAGILDAGVRIDREVAPVERAQDCQGRPRMRSRLSSSSKCASDGLMRSLRATMPTSASDCASFTTGRRSSP